MSRAPKDQRRVPAEAFDMGMAALVVILEDEAEEAAKDDSSGPPERPKMRDSIRTERVRDAEVR